jgi:EmrB/QacA subfamily drug resistance transporter
MSHGPDLNRILAAAILGSSLVFLDTSVANVILPRIQDGFHKGLLDLQWVVTAYGVTLSALLLLGGVLGDRYGRRRVFLAGLTLFGLASAICALSPGFWGLVAARSLQGVGAALLTPESLAILSATFPDDRRAGAIGAWSAASALAGVIGPPLGGWITDVAGWRAVFWLNVPIALVAAYLGWVSIPDNCSESRAARFDIRGALLAPLGLGLLIFGMTQGLLWTVAGLGLIWLFFLSESRAKSPLLPLEVFKNRGFSRINGMTFFLSAAYSMVFFFLPGHLIRVEHYDAAHAGLALAPAGLMIAVLSRPVGSWMVSLGTTIFLVGGAAFLALGCAALSFASSTRGYFVSYFPGILLMGIGLGLTATPLTELALSSLREEESGLASGINNAVARVAGVIGVTVAAGLLTWTFRALMGQGWKKDPMMPVPAAIASDEFMKQVEAARWSSYRELLWGAVAMSALAALSVANMRVGAEVRSDESRADRSQKVVSSFCFRPGRTTDERDR